MKGKIIIYTFVFLCYAGLFAFNRSGYVSYPNLKAGEVLISDASFTSNSEMLLNGEWEFYFNELLHPQDFENKVEKNIRYVPGYWQHDWDETKVDVNGYATYRLLVHFESEKASVGIQMPWVCGAYEMLVNGKNVLQCGTVGTSPATELPDARSQVTVIPLNSDTMEIIIRISGYVNGTSGIFHSIAIGAADKIIAYSNANMAEDIVIIGCFFIMGFYRLNLFFLWRKDRANLYYALTCVLGMVWHGTISQGLLLSLLPPNNGLIASIIYEISLMWFWVFFSFFIYHLFAKQYGVGKKNLRAILGVCCLGTVFCLLRKYIISWSFFWSQYLLYILCLALILRILIVIWKNKEPSRLMFTLGVGFILFGKVSDALVDFGVIYTEAFGSSSFAVFVFVEAIILARRYIGYYEENERLLLNLEDEVGKRTAQLQEANVKLVSMEKTRKELMSNISHDLRTPITAVRGYMELIMKNKAIDETTASYTTSAQHRINQMENLIKDLFFLTQLTDKKLSMTIIPVDIASVLQECFQNYVAVARVKGICLTLEPVLNNNKVLADQVRLMRVMDNLMQNALFYAATQITICVKEQNDKLIISVVDDGEGIAPEHLPCIFDRFFKTRNDGAGLGLCIVKELVAQMGGGVFAESVPFVKTELGFYLLVNPNVK